jgi:hypothetical protein
MIVASSASQTFRSHATNTLTALTGTAIDFTNKLSERSVTGRYPISLLNEAAGSYCLDEEFLFFIVLHSTSTLKRKIMNIVKSSRRALVIGLAVLCLNMLAFSSRPISASGATRVVGANQNDELDFTLVNQTGYGIKLLYIGPSNNPEWTDDMEILKGRVFKTGTQMPIRFSPKTKAKKWDIMVKWTDGSKSAQWIGLDLTSIEKLTILYNPETDATTYRIN